MKMNRRSFIIGSAAATGGLALGFRLPFGGPEVVRAADGSPMRSCSIPASAVAGRKITTIEGLAAGGALTKVQKAWIEHDVPQCGYCQSGMIMAAAALLKAKPKPTDADIDAAMTNICRCGTFQQVREAIHTAAKA